MDFLDPDKQRAHRIRLYVGYMLMTLSISFIALLLVFQAYGYNLDLRTGDITQKGLLFIDAHPESAEVFLNGETKGNTDKRLFVPAGEYSLELRRNGYRTWRRNFVIMGGKIRRYVYPFLFPENMEPKQTQLYASEPKFTSQSPDRRWLIVQDPNQLISFSLVDLNSELANAVQLNLPSNLFQAAGVTHGFEAVEWSTNNRHLIVKHNYDGGAEFALIDREQPQVSVNLTRVFSAQPFTGIAFLDKQFDQYYLHSASSGQLSKAELESAVVTPFITNVFQFKPHGDNMILYITAKESSEGRVQALLREGENTYTLRDFPSGDHYLMDIARFDGKWYVVAGASGEKKVYVYRDPQVALRRSPASALIPAATMRLESPEFVSFSANARFIAAQSGSQFNIYDAELATTYRFTMGTALPRGLEAVWMDGHRITAVAEGTVQVVDFDGSNHQVLVPSYSSHQPYFDRDFTAMYTLAPAQIEGRAALFRSQLRLTAD